jgi:hypothetical protein
MSENNDSKEISTIGKIAYDWLIQSDQAVVWGNTSKGLFLQIPDDKIIFLTESPNFGPANIMVKNQIPIHWKNADRIKIIHGVNAITLSNQHDDLEINIDKIWSTPEKPARKISFAEQQNRLLQSARQLTIFKDGKGFSSLLIPVLQNEPTVNLDDQWLNHSFDKIMLLKQSLLEKDKEKVISVARQLIGSGQGLTPSGDDLLTGLLFMQKRWFENIEWLDEIDQNLMNEFQQHTTAQSSTLFLCALQGEAIAYIQEMSDTLMNTDIPFDKQAIQLARWGNSSGADVFLGIILAIQCFQ